jgi:molybdate transport system ATP-binding protein
LQGAKEIFNVSQYCLNDELLLHNSSTLITLDHVTLRVRDRFLLAGTSWEIRPGENWVVVGPNGAGKTSLMGALAGTVPVVAGRILRNWDPAKENPVGYVSFEQQKKMMAREAVRDESRFFSGQPDALTTVADYLREAAGPEWMDRRENNRLLQALGIGELLHRGVARLSTGEVRKVLITRALMGSPRLLVLDEPFQGLDRKARENLRRMIGLLVQAGRQVVLVTHRPEDVPPGFTHLLVVRDDRVQPHPWQRPKRYRSPLLQADGPRIQNTVVEPLQTKDADVLIEFRDVTVRYGEHVVLGELDWIFREGEHWAVTGPNGAGKTSLLQMISADHPQAYANEIYLFGRRRGSGESIWEIKRSIGMVGPEMQLRHCRHITAADVVVSGFYDSVGLYRTPRPEEVQAARNWLEKLKMLHSSESCFDRLSFGEQRLVLIARAMVKSPLLLVLDEPCQGLDPGNRHRVLERVNQIVRTGRTHLLFVTHHEDEIPVCVNRELHIEKPVAGKTPARIVRQR